jgi:hypothetical protein
VCGSAGFISIDRSSIVTDASFEERSKAFPMFGVKASSEGRDVSIKVPGDFGEESVRNAASAPDFSTNVVARDKNGSCSVNAGFPAE